MPDGTITLDLPEGEQLVEQIVEEAARQSLRMLTAAGPDGEQSEVPTALARRIEDTIRETIEAEARSAAPKVAEAILAEGVQQTTEYGSARGEKRPVRDIVAEKVIEQLTRSTGRGAMGREKSIIDEMIEGEVKKQIRAELQGALDEAKQAITEAVGAEATKALVDALNRALPGVKV